MLTNIPTDHIRGRIYELSPKLLISPVPKQCLSDFVGRVYSTPYIMTPVPRPSIKGIWPVKQIQQKGNIYVKRHFPDFDKIKNNKEIIPFNITELGTQFKGYSVNRTLYQQATHRFPRLLQTSEIMDDDFYAYDFNNLDKEALCKLYKLKRYWPIAPGVFYIRDYSKWWEFARSTNSVIYAYENDKGVGGNINLIVDHNDVLGIPIVRYYSAEVLYIDAEVKYIANPDLTMCAVMSGTMSKEYFDSLKPLNEGIYSFFRQGFISVYVNQHTTESELIANGFVLDPDLEQHTYFSNGTLQKRFTLVNNSRIKKDTIDFIAPEAVSTLINKPKNDMITFGTDSGELYNPDGDPEVSYDYYGYCALYANDTSESTAEFDPFNGYSVELSVNHNQGVNISRRSPNIHSIDTTEFYDTDMSSFPYEPNNKLYGVANHISTEGKQSTLVPEISTHNEGRHPRYDFEYIVKENDTINIIPDMIYYNPHRNILIKTNPIMQIITEYTPNTLHANTNEINTKQSNLKIDIRRLNEVATRRNKLISKIQDFISSKGKYFCTMCPKLNAFYDYIKQYYDRKNIQANPIMTSKFEVDDSILLVDGTDDKFVPVSEEESTVDGFVMPQGGYILTKKQSVQYIQLVGATLVVIGVQTKPYPVYFLGDYTTYDRMFGRAAYLLLRYGLSIQYNINFIYYATKLTDEEFISAYPEYAYYTRCFQDKKVKVASMTSVAKIQRNSYKEETLIETTNALNIIPIEYTDDEYNVQYDRQLPWIKYNHAMNKKNISVKVKKNEFDTSVQYFDTPMKISGRNPIHIRFNIKDKYCDWNMRSMVGLGWGSTWGWGFGWGWGGSGFGWGWGSTWGSIGFGFGSGSGSGFGYGSISPSLRYNWGYFDLPSYGVNVNLDSSIIAQRFPFAPILIPFTPRIQTLFIKPTVVKVRKHVSDLNIFPVPEKHVYIPPRLYHILPNIYKVSILKQTVVGGVINEIFVESLGPRIVNQTRFSLGKFNRFKESNRAFYNYSSPLNQTIVLSMNSKAYLKDDGKLNKFSRWINYTGKRVMVNIEEKISNIEFLQSKTSIYFELYTINPDFYTNFELLCVQLSTTLFAGNTFNILIQPEAVYNPEFSSFQDRVLNTMYKILNKYGTNLKVNILINENVSKDTINKIKVVPNFNKFIISFNRLNSLYSLIDFTKDMHIVPDTRFMAVTSGLSVDDLSKSIDILQNNIDYNDIILFNDITLTIPNEWYNIFNNKDK